MDKLDVENLQKLAYDRSQTWATFFDVFENVEKVEGLEDEDIDIMDIEEAFFSPEKSYESDNDLSSMEDTDYADNVNSEFLQNASSHTNFSLLNGNTTMDLLAITRNDKERQYVDVINQTLPVVNEHNRQLKEHGFDKVLMSFKKDIIEKKFGTWLNRHNSLFVNDRSLSECEKHKHYATGKELGKNSRSKSSCIKYKELDSDSDASLQSGETARYIRSSKVGNSKNSATTLIKTYRTVNSTRKALREKYAYEIDDEYNVNKLRSSKRIGSVAFKNYYDQTPYRRSSKSEMVTLSTKSHRRKMYRKRVNCNSRCSRSSSSSSSSDSEYSENRYKKSGVHVNKYQCTATNYHITPLTSVNKNVIMSSAVRNRLYYFSRSHSMSVSSTSSSSPSYNSICEKRRTTKRSAKFVKDVRPRKRESQCCCSNDKKLCKKFKHVADTSTSDNWYVENASPQKTIKKSSPTKKQITTAQKCRESEADKHNITSEKSLEEDKTVNESNSSLNKSSDLELQIAIKASKETYEKEQKCRLGKLSTTLKKSSKDKTENLSKETKTKNTISQKTDVVKKPRDSDELKPSKEETFFTSNKTLAICNSTALPGDGQAYKRQFADKQQIVEEDEKKDDTVIDLKQAKTKSKPIKKKITSTKIYADKAQNKNAGNRTKVTSTTKRSPVLHLSSILPQTVDNKIDEIIEISGDELTGCTHVTSTTNVDATLAQTNKKEATMLDATFAQTNKKETTVVDATLTRMNNKKATIVDATLAQTNKKETTIVDATLTQTNKKETAIVDATLTQTNNKEAQTNNKEAKNQSQQNKTILNSLKNLTRKCILIHDPDNQTIATSNNLTGDGCFTVTKEHLSAVIGEKIANKFFKYYIGCKRFNINSKVYYQPPSNSYYDQILSTSSESADDLEYISQYGYLFSVNKK